MIDGDALKADAAHRAATALLLHGLPAAKLFDAAKDLGMSVPTIWEQVRLLEQRYASPLFERRGRRIYPTPVGRVPVSVLAAAAGRNRLHVPDRARAGRGLSAQLTLVTGVRMILEELGKPLARFRQAAPGHSLRLLHGDDRTAQRLIVAGEADLALLLEPSPGRLDEAVCHERAYQIECLAIAPKDHALGRQAVLAAGRPGGLPADRRPAGDAHSQPAGPGAAPRGPAGPLAAGGGNRQQRRHDRLRAGRHGRRDCGRADGRHSVPRPGDAARCAGSSATPGSCSNGKKGDSLPPRSAVSWT